MMNNELPDIIQPQPGPQTAFLTSTADICIYAGEAGSGKSYAALMSLAAGIHLPGYGAVCFRRTSPQLTGAGSLWTESHQLFRSLSGYPVQSPVLCWTFDTTKYTGKPHSDSATIEFRHLQHETDMYEHQGKQYAQVIFDELTHFEEEQFWYLFTRLRTTCGVEPFLRATTNADSSSWVRQLVDWWIDSDPNSPTYGQIDENKSGVLRWFIRNDKGMLVWADTKKELEEQFSVENGGTGDEPKSLTVIKAKTKDNQKLLEKDPGYISRLGVASKVQRARLKDGNWNIKADAGTLFQGMWFKTLDTPPEPHSVIARVRAWDKASTPPSDTNKNPDWTRGVLISLLNTGHFVIEHIASCQDTPQKVHDLMAKCAATDHPDTIIATWQDPGQAGVVDIDTTKRLLGSRLVKSIKATKNKLYYAEHWSAKAEKGQVYIMRGAWNPTFIAEAEAFPDPKDRAKDDIIDATSLAFQVFRELGYENIAGQITGDYPTGPVNPFGAFLAGGGLRGRSFEGTKTNAPQQDPGLYNGMGTNGMGTPATQTTIPSRSGVSSQGYSTDHSSFQPKPRKYL